MKSPFPGMDPYLEARWSDVHATLIALIKEGLQPSLPSSLRARSEERVILEAIEEPVQSYRSDVAVIDTGRPGTGGGSTGTLEASTDTVAIQFYDGPEVERWVHIIDTSNGNRVVTAIEVLSKWNKGPGKLNKQYRQKVKDYKRGGVSVVEIDLLRDPGRGRLEVITEDLPANKRTPYLVCVRRAWEAWQWIAYPIGLRQRLPVISIPLRETDKEVPLDLQPLMDRVYVAGGHDDIDYAKPANPPLTFDDATWVSTLITK
jgi:hypothetical protein